MTGMEFDLPDNKGKMVLVRRPNEDAIYRILPKKPGTNKLKFDFNPTTDDLELCADAANQHFPNTELTNALIGILDAKKNESNSE